MRAARTAATLVLAAALAGCGGAGPVAAPSPSTAGGPAVSPSEPPPSAGDPLADPPPPGRRGPTTTVRGVVVEGVEAGCLLLAGDGVEYLLVGGPRDQLRAGSRLEVTGRLDPELMTTCQQGTPLLVVAVSPVG